MTLLEIFEIVTGNKPMLCVGIIALLSVVEISKIKINPLTWIGKMISFLFLGDIKTKLNELTDQFTDLKTEMIENSAMSSRYRILRFDDEILHGVMHTKEHFDTIMVDINVYEAFCERNPDFKNNVAKESIKHIKEVYQECKEKKSFL